MRMGSYCAMFALALIASNTVAQQKPPDLTGTLSFDIDSDSGRVERLAVTIGDGGSGRYKAILAGDPSLPTHAIYRPRDLRPFGGRNLLPIVAFGNGGCRNGSGEFRNFLSDIASHGYLVVAIGPAGDAVVGGSEGPGGQTQASQLLDGVDWATKENDRKDSEYYQKVDTSKVAVMGQSCGTGQATQVSGDARVTTTVFMNGGPTRAGAPPSAQRAAVAAPGDTPEVRGAYGTYDPRRSLGTSNEMSAALARMTKRYAPYGITPPRNSSAAAQPSQPSFHGPVAFINGGPSDTAYNRALSGFEEVQNVPALFAFQDVGHYPATYRQPHGGAFAVAVEAWLDWTLKGDKSASRMFVGSSCGLCTDPKWKVQIKNLP
jgi:dienelactone hydrolase